MDFDDFDDDYLEVSPRSFSGDDVEENQTGNEHGFDPFNLNDPETAYLFFSDDVQDELGNPLNRRLRCLLCGYEIVGRKTDHCPMCWGTMFGEAL